MAAATIYWLRPLSFSMTKATKVSMRHSAKDQEHLDTALDHMVSAGAQTSDSREKAALNKAANSKSLPARVTTAIKALDPSYSGMEAMDICTGAEALRQLASLAQSEAYQGEPDDVAKLCDLMDQLLEFISGEVDEMRAGEPATAETVAVETPAAEVVAPEAMATPAMLSVRYIKHLHLPHTDQYMRDVVAVKSLGNGMVRGYLALWGDPATVDLEHEFFTKSTNFWDAQLKDAGYKAPLTWDHAQDPGFKADPRIGTITEQGDDDIGRWYEAQLDLSHKYYTAVAKLVSGRKVGTSSDSAPQYVERERTKSGSVWLKQWPLFAAALTITPCEPRMMREGAPGWDAIAKSLPPIRMDSGAGLDSLSAAKRYLDLLKLTIGV